MAKKNPLSDLIGKTEKLRERTLTNLDKDYHEVTQYQIEAIGRLIQTIKDLDKRNRALQIAVLALGFVTAFSASYQFLRDWLNPHPLGNFFMSLGFTFLFATIVSVWLKKR